MCGANRTVSLPQSPNLVLLVTIEVKQQLKYQMQCISLATHNNGRSK